MDDCAHLMHDDTVVKKRSDEKKPTTSFFLQIGAAAVPWYHKRSEDNAVFQQE